MNVWIIQIGELLPLAPGMRRMRSGLLATALATRGHEVTWWTSAFDHFSKAWICRHDSVRVVEGPITLRLLRGTGYRRNISLRRFIDHAVIARKFSRMASQLPAPDIIVAALPDHRVAYAAYMFASNAGIPFILDLRDRWPWDFLTLLPLRLRPIARRALAKDFNRTAEIIRGAEGIATMMESWIDWTRRDIGRRGGVDDRVFYLGAERPHAPDVVQNEKVRQIVQNWRSKWIVLFVGAFTSRSAPLVVLEAARIIEESHPAVAQSVRFVLAGDGDYMPAVQRAARDLHSVALPGFLDNPSIAALLDNSKIGVVTANVDFDGVPNKVFTYLSGGLPLVSSIRGELETLIASEQIGLQYSDASSLVRVILLLHENEMQRLSMSQRAAALFSRRFDSGVIFEQFADYVELSSRNMQLTAKIC